MNICFSSNKKSGFIIDIDAKENFSDITKYLCKIYDIEHFYHLKQVHGNTIFVDDSGEGDGIILTKPNSAGIILTADCYPISLYDPVSKISGIFHSGWRGTVAQIVPLGISKMQELGCKNIIATIFPGIAQCCFEIGEELESFFLEHNIPIQKKASRLYADLYSAIYSQLKNGGIEHIENRSQCTCCNDDYFSYRRNQTMKRHASFIAT